MQVFIAGGSGHVGSAVIPIDPTAVLSPSMRESWSCSMMALVASGPAGGPRASGI
jgi:hypothetical protein